jgi:hypothetical protein
MVLDYFPTCLRIRNTLKSPAPTIGTRATGDNYKRDFLFRCCRIKPASWLVCRSTTTELDRPLSRRKDANAAHQLYEDIGLWRE